MDELNREYKASDIEINKPETSEKADKFNAAHYSTGAVAASFTSTAMAPKLIHEAAIIHEDELRYDRVKKKGIVVYFLMNIIVINKNQQISIDIQWAD